MAATTDLPVERVRRALRLVERVRHVESDRSACLSTACAGLKDLFSASVAVIGQLRSSHPSHLIELASIGWRNDAARGLVMTTSPEAAGSALPLLGLAELHPSAATARRCDLLPDADWNVHPHLIMRCRPAGLDDFIVSSFTVGPASGDRGVILLYRDIGAYSFSEGDRELLHALSSECGARFWSGVVTPNTPAVTVRPVESVLAAPSAASAGPTRAALLARLTPAQRVVLPYLLEGKTEAEIGKLVFRSRYTVHDHARAIYLALGVRNRVELVLLFNRAVDSPQAAMAG
jgi:DNA-binding CsgD family transcriptional regulator